MLQIKVSKKINDKQSIIVANPNKKLLKSYGLKGLALDHLLNLEEGDVKEVNLFDKMIYTFKSKAHKSTHIQTEYQRDLGSKLFNILNNAKLNQVIFDLDQLGKVEGIAFLEGAILASYQFLKYFTNSEKRVNTLRKASISSSLISAKDLTSLSNITTSVAFARDLVNEPVHFLTAEQLSKEISILEDDGIKVTVFNKRQIESLKMGGLLAVNKGATNPPTFNVLEYKPKKAKNKKPIILVGKGVVYDTGGANIKVADFMMGMKADMGGSAAVIGAIQAIAKNKLPYHVISLIPATENRINGHEYVPGDVITMHSGKTVEVLNTDAEGRMVLADALSYAQKYNPELVLDLATLTGAAYRAIGTEGIVFMGTAAEKTKSKLREAGNNTFERLVEFPFWDEYAEQIKSPIADMTNLGGPTGGAITAGKFLENFTDYPWLHLDIAGPAYLAKDSSYRLTGGTGSGVRLLYNFISTL